MGSENEDYQINTEENNSATIKIINNDIEGMTLLLSGEKLRVSENGGNGEFQLVLNSQPGSDVEINITEEKINGRSQLGDGSSPFSLTKTFTPTNWFIPQVISVSSFDDFEIEDGTGENLLTGIHPTQLKYQFKSDDQKYNSDTDKSSDHFTNFTQDVEVVDYKLPTETADSLTSSLTSLQEGIDSLSLPIVGNLNGKTGGGLRKFITNLSNKIKEIVTPTPSKLEALIDTEIEAALGDGADVTLAMTTVDDEHAIDVGFTFEDAYNVADIPLDASFGLPGLGFQSYGNLNADFSYNAGLNIIFPRSGEIYLNTSADNTFLNANFTTKLSDDFKLEGGLGLLQLEAVNKTSANENIKIGDEQADTQMAVDFTLNLNGGAGEDDKFTFAELTDADTDLEEVFQYEITGDAAMSFGMTTSVNNSAAVPSFSFDMASLLPLFDYSNTKEVGEEKNATKFYFDDIKLDLGSYITQMLDPVVGGIDSILEPIYPIVDALYADTKIFDTIGLESTFDYDKDKAVSSIDLANWFADFYKTIDPLKGESLQATVRSTTEFLDTTKGVMDLVRELDALAEEGNFYVDFGSYEMDAFNAGDSTAQTEAIDVDSNADDLNQDVAEKADEGGKDKDGKSSSSFKKIMAQLDELGFKIDLIDDPKNAIKLLMGQEVDLFSWDMGDMGMESEISKNFPIYPGIEGVIDGGFGVEANLGFGFDSAGLNEWSNSNFKAADSWKVFNGFYVADEDDDGKDIPEFTLDASMGAGLGLSAVVVRSDITGGLTAGASFDLLDEGEIAGNSDGKIRGEEITSRISNPLDLFELVGDLSAFLKSKVQMGIDLGFYSIWETVWKETLAEIPIFEFGIGGSYGSGTASNGYLKNATVFFDSNFNGRIDSFEPSAITGDDAHYNFRVDHQVFDTNRNGAIDLSEGRLMVYGGIDDTTGLALDVPFLAPLGGMITPLTTLHTLAIGSGLSEEKADSWIRDAFDIGNFDYLNDDPVLALKQAKNLSEEKSKDSLAAYLGHLKLHLAIDVLTNTLQQALPHDIPENLDYELELLTAFSEVLFAQSSSAPLKQLIFNALSQTTSKLHPHTEEHLGDQLDLIAKMAANANFEIGERLDDIVNRAKESDKSPLELLNSLNQLKTFTLGHYREKVAKISEGLNRLGDLHTLEDPSAYLKTISDRVKDSHGDFLSLTAKLKESDKAGDTTAPLISSGSSIAGATDGTKTLIENSKIVEIFNADEDVTWSLSGGTDIDKFNIDSSSGSLSFISKPDFENALDADSDNSYEVTVSAQDTEGNKSEQAFTVIIENRIDTSSSKILKVKGQEKKIFFKGGELKSGSDVTLYAPVLAKASKLNLNRKKITINDSAIDFKLDVENAKDANPDSDKGISSSLILDVDLVADSILSNVTNTETNTKKSDVKWTYLSITDGGVVEDLSYDPTNNAGARFYDLEGGDGIADTIHLTLVDGGYGDKDGEINGVIVDPSTAGTVSLDPSFSTNDNASKLITLSDNADETAEANHLIKVSLDETTLSNTSDEIGYVVINKINNQFETLTTEIVKNRSQRLFNTLENNDVQSLENASNIYNQEILLGNDQGLYLYHIKDATIKDIKSLEDDKFSYFSANDTESLSDKINLTTTNGLKINLEEQNTDQGLDAFIAKHQHNVPILDFENMGFEEVNAELQLAREANFDSIVGFYRVIDQSGGVIDELTGNIINPGDENYASAALAQANLVSELAGLKVEDNTTTITPNLKIEENAIIAPYAIVNENTFFAYADANADGYEHFKSLGTNTFGFEDIYGGGDKDNDDMIISFNFSNVNV